MGLARDGGLLLPAEYPRVEDRLDAWRRLAYPELAFEILRLYADDLPTQELRRILAHSYAGFSDPAVAPVRPLGPLHLLELFHGPTLAFKDFALQFLGRLFEHLLQDSDAELNLLAATSGDTGSAAIHGIRGRRRLRIFVLHPRGRVSPIQERQMTTVTDDNVFNLAVDGTFDDCQEIVQGACSGTCRSATPAGSRVTRSTGPRVLAQTVYYFHAVCRVQAATGARRVRFCVPTGNFGDVFAGYVAWRMGLPIDRLIVATNENDILARFFRTGEYRAGPVAQTLSPSMDIQVASNFERYLFHRAGDDPAAVRRWMADFARQGVLRVEPAADGAVDPLFLAGSGTTDQTLATIRRQYERHGVVLDPHTAVGVAVAERHLDPAAPTICLATAHPAKFPEAIRRALGRDGLATHPAIERLQGLPRRLDHVPASVAAVAGNLRARLFPASGAGQ